MIVKDAMVLIHMAKLSLLKTSCDFFGDVIIPSKVREETVVKGKEKGFPDAVLIEEIIEDGSIQVIEVGEERLIERANEFNIQGGEAEAVALYWEKDADFLATDDDNVRSKKALLELNIIGTLSILLKLFKKEKIGATKLERSLDTLREIGWFSSAVLDRAAMEAGI